VKNDEGKGGLKYDIYESQQGRTLDLTDQGTYCMPNIMYQPKHDPHVKLTCKNI
jgi:hypothetical protein